MATKSINAKSQTIAARIPHDVANSMNELKSEGESIGQFVTEALRREIQYRQLKLAKKSADE